MSVCRCGTDINAKSGSHGGRPPSPLCQDCRDAEEVEATKVKGWNRGPRGVLVGSKAQCVGYPCTEHHFCSNKESAA